MAQTCTIRRALESIIYQYAQSKGLNVVFENIEQPSQETTYLETHLMPAKTEFETFAGNKEHGIFQINIYAPLGESVVNADTIADEVIELYPVGKQQNITIEQPTYRNQGQYVNGWYTVSVTVDYRS